LLVKLAAVEADDGTAVKLGINATVGGPVGHYHITIAFGANGDDLGYSVDIEHIGGQITQVFSNLMLNAIQAMGGGGELKIATMLGKSIEGILQTVKIQISDNGPGIPEDMLKKLFDPFFTTKHGGTGLGLTITHNIVDGHKGYIDVDSQVGKGTMFTVTLPVSQGLL